MRGRRRFAMSADENQRDLIALGTHSLQDSIMLNLHASPEWRDKYLAPLVAGESDGEHG